MPSGHDKAYTNWLAFIKAHPTPQDILNYHLMDDAQAQVRILQDTLQKTELTTDEQEGMEGYIQLELLNQTAKIDALIEIGRQSS